MRKKVSDIEPGDTLDLHGDRYADPAGTDRTYAVEYAEVIAVDPEVDGWIRLHFEGLPTVSFPADHAIPVNPVDPMPSLPGPH